MLREHGSFFRRMTLGVSGKVLSAAATIVAGYLLLKFGISTE
ncbi:MAG: hypothetical protein QOG77_90 [Solirubrobacteraceae bacterium]|jgi:hypothetical protein|nr:hypothetical protein [Solirubrobacteraceae bacterium]